MLWDEAIAVIGDVHLADTPPGRRAEGYYDDIVRKLEEALSWPSDVVVWIGDLFHHKAANRVSHRLVQTFADLMSDGRLHYIVPGNHDLADGTLESIARQPIGVLGKLPNVKLLIGNETLPSGTVLYGVPGTGPVCDATEEGLDSWFPPELVHTDIVFAHAPISTEKKPWPTWHPTEVMQRGILVYGHQHDEARYVGDFGTAPDVLSVVATGAIARGSISEADTTPSFVTFSDGMICVEPLQSARPKEDIYRWSELTAEKVEDAAISGFIEQLSAAKLAGFSKEGIVSDLRSRSDITPDVRDRAVEILEAL